MVIDETVYNPKWDKSPNLRDIFAMGEHSMPGFSHVPELAAKFIGIKPEEYDPIKHTPLVLATWRYRCADAMLHARDMRD